jgi:hypothetical protein
MNGFARQAFPAGAASVGLGDTLDALIAATRQAVAAAQSARRALAGQLPAAAGGMTAGDVGSFGT